MCHDFSGKQIGAWEPKIRCEIAFLPFPEMDFQVHMHLNVI
jgi:hypothetical protein